MRRLALPLVAFAFAVPAGGGELATAERAVIKAAATTRSSIVTVIPPGKQSWDLTGVLVAARDLVLTLRRPLLDAKGAIAGPLRVRFPGRGKTVDAELVDEDEETGIVLLRARGGSGKPIRPRLAGHARLGMWVLMVGNTFRSGRESEPVVSLGVISGIERDDDGRVKWLHASTLVNPGSFGAPVVDLDGGLLGVLAAAVTDAGQQSVVIPYERVLENFLERGSKGARALGTRPYRRARGSSLHELVAVVLEAAARRAAPLVVGVRSGEPESAPPAPVPGKGPPEKPGPAPNKKKPAGRPMPAPVRGKLPAYDRSSGTILSADGLVLCPLRVTGWPGPPRRLTVDLPDGRERPARLLGRDERLRVALLKIEAGGLSAPVAAPLDGIRPGQFALALGFGHEDPRHASLQLTFGVVSRLNALLAVHPGFRAVQTDAGVSGGNRGGPLVDVEGRLMGVLLDVNDTDRAGYETRRVAGYGGNSGLGFALPMPVVSGILPRLLAGEVLRPARLGAGLVPAPGGLELTVVGGKNSKGEPVAASQAGLAVGDLLISVDGQPVSRLPELLAVLGRHVAGDEVELVYERGGQRHVARVTLREP